MRHAITTAACLALFVIGFSLQPILSTQRNTNDRTTHAESTRELQEAANIPAETAFDLLGAFHAIKEQNDQSLPFQTHYLALSIAQRLTASDLVTMLQFSEDLAGNEAGIVSLIFGLELAYRDRFALIDFINRRATLGNRSLNLKSLFRYWAKSDPQAAYETAIQLLEPNRALALQGIIYSGDEAMALKAQNFRSSDDSREAKLSNLAKALETEHWRSNRAEFLTLFQSAYSDFPEQGIAFAKGIENPALRSQALNQLFNSKIKDPLLALQSIHELQTEQLLKNPRHQIDYISRVLRNSDNGQVSPALDWLTQNYDPQIQAAIIENLSLNSSDNSLAILQSQFFQQIPDSSAKTGFLRRALGVIANQDWQEALQVMERVVPPDRVEYVLPSIISQAYANAGSEIAIELLDAIDQPRLRFHAVSQLSNSWGTADPISFLSWAASQSDRYFSIHNFEFASNSWAQKDLDGLREFEANLDSGVVKDALQRKIGQKLAEIDPLSAIEYAAQMENLTEATNILIEASRRWAMDDPESAADFVNSALTAEESQRAARIIAFEWAGQDAAAATAYFNSIRESASGQAGLDASLTHWLRVDLGSATNYLSTLPSGPSRDTICMNFVSDIRNSQLNPEVTLRIISMIDNPTKREQAILSYDNVRSRYETP